MVAVIRRQALVGRKARIPGSSNNPKVLIVRQKGSQTSSVHDYETGQRLGTIPSPDVSLVRSKSKQQGSIHLTSTGSKIGDFTVEPGKPQYFDFNNPTYAQQAAVTQARRFQDQPSGQQFSAISDATGRVNILGNDYYSRSKRDYDYLTKLKAVIKRDEAFKEAIKNDISKYGLDIEDGDKWYNRALKGGGKASLYTVRLPEQIYSGIDKAVLSRSAYNFKGDKPLSKEFTQAASKERARTRRALPGEGLEMIKALDPRKPENWANIIITVAPIAKAVRGASRLSADYQVAIRNATKVEAELLKAEARASTALSLAKKSIRAGSNVEKNRALITKATELKKNLRLSIKYVRKIQKDPRTVPLIGYNPITKSAKLIRQLKKERYYFHATSARPKDIFGKSYTKLRSQKEILSIVRRETVPPRMLKMSGVEKDIFGVVKKEKGILTGARAQNLQVKNFLLKRKTKDIDLISENNKLLAKKIKLKLQKKYGSRVTLGSFSKKISGKKATVWRVLIDGKQLVDVSQKKGIPFINRDGLRIARSDYLAYRKRAVIGDIKESARHAKDRKDLRKLTGRIFSNKGFETKVKQPRNQFTVQAQPKGMGAGRIKFNEDQMFFDLEVPTNYAYKGLGRSSVPRVVTDVAKKLGLPKKAAKRIQAMRTIRFGDRFTIFRMKSKVSNFVNDRRVPLSLRNRVRLASKGKLSSKQSVALRRDMVKYIRARPNRAFLGSRTGSMISGEREIVIPTGSFIKGKNIRYGRFDKFTIDPETKVYADVVDIAFRRAKVKNPGFASKLKAYSPKEIAFRVFTKGDLAKVRKYARLIKKSKQLSPNYKSQLERFTRRLSRKVSRWQGIRGRRGKIPTPSASVINRGPLSPVARARFARSVRGAIRRKLKGPYVVPSRSRQAVAAVARRREFGMRREEPRAAIRPSTRFVGRPVSRAAVRQATRPQIRPGARVRTPTRQTPRPGKRVVSRPNMRPVERVVARPTARIVPRVVRRPRIPPRMPPRIRPPTPPPMILSIRDPVKKKKALIRWIQMQSPIYRPSLFAIFFGVYGRMPKRITGLEIRPIIRKR